MIKRKRTESGVNEKKHTKDTNEQVKRNANNYNKKATDA